MPFTVSHVIAVVPVRRLRFLRAVPWSALVIGAMSPDAIYYIGLAQWGWMTHTLAGLLLLDVPIAVLLTLLWLRLMRPAVVDLAPSALRERWIPAIARTGAVTDTGRPGWRTLLAIAAGGLVGAFTHVLWDEFTHIDRWGMWLFPVLGDDLGPFPWYQWLQYVSSAVGALALAILFVRWCRSTAPEPVPSRLIGQWRRPLQLLPFGLASLVPPAVYFSLGGGAGRYTLAGWDGFATLVLFISGFGVGAVISSVVWWRLIRSQEDSLGSGANRGVKG